MSLAASVAVGGSPCLYCCSRIATRARRASVLSRSSNHECTAKLVDLRCACLAMAASMACFADWFSRHAHAMKVAAWARTLDCALTLTTHRKAPQAARAFSIAARMALFRRLASRRRRKR